MLSKGLVADRSNFLGNLKNELFGGIRNRRSVRHAVLTSGNAIVNIPRVVRDDEFRGSVGEIALLPRRLHLRARDEGGKDTDNVKVSQARFAPV